MGLRVQEVENNARERSDTITDGESCCWDCYRQHGVSDKQAVDIGVNGLLDILLGQSKDYRLKEMNEHHDKLLEIVNHSNVPHLQDLSSARITPMNASQSLKNEIETANSHIRSAITELMEARITPDVGCAGVNLRKE